MKVLFVCLGNICRSPTAEGVFNSLVDREGLQKKISADSAGTSGHHQGDQADIRSIRHAELRGYSLTSTSRQIKENDFTDFDMILTMDNSNYEALIRFGNELNADIDKVKKFTSYCQIHEIEEVPDPYYNGHDGFEHVLDIVEDGCKGLLMELRSKI